MKNRLLYLLQYPGAFIASFLLMFYFYYIYENFSDAGNTFVPEDFLLYVLVYFFHLAIIYGLIFFLYKTARKDKWLLLAVLVSIPLTFLQVFILS